MIGFRPGGPVHVFQYGATISADLESDAGAWVYVANITSATAFIATGPNSDVTAGFADSPVAHADFPIPAGQVAALGMPEGHRYVAAYLAPVAASDVWPPTGRVFVCRGATSW
jgi:hypothetical protein